MQTWIDTVVELPIVTTPPVDDLLAVYLGQSCGSRAPEPEYPSPVAQTLDLWDYLGDFA
jgi:hypothetical protein